MYDIANSPPIPSILHEHHSLSPTRPRHHGLWMPTRVNGTPSINQFLERLARVYPDERRSPACSAENLAVLFGPADDEASRVVGHLIERLIDDGPTADMGRQMCETRVASKVLVQEETSHEEDDEFGDSDRFVHF